MTGQHLLPSKEETLQTIPSPSQRDEIPPPLPNRTIESVVSPAIPERNETATAPPPPPVPQINETSPPPLPSRPIESAVSPPLPERNEAVPPPLPQRLAEETHQPPPILEKPVEDIHQPSESTVPPPMPKRPSESTVPPPLPQRPIDPVIPPSIPKRSSTIDTPPTMPQRPVITEELSKELKSTSVGSETGSNSVNFRRQSGNVPPQLPTRPMEATRPPQPRSNNVNKDKNPYVYNGFNWKLFFTKVGIDEYSAKHYAERFVKEKFDEELILDADHDILKKMGLREGDIIRVKKATLQDHENAKV